MMDGYPLWGLIIPRCSAGNHHVHVPSSHMSHWPLTLILPLPSELSFQRDKYNPYSHLQGGLTHLHPQCQHTSVVHLPTKRL